MSVGKKIGVLYGGMSAEREVSLRSGQAIYEALKRRGHQVVLVDVDQNIAEVLKKEKIELAYLALHGRYGEDGCVQGVLEILQIPYTGASLLGSGLAMDKYLSKELLQGTEIPLAQHDFLDLNQNKVAEFLTEYTWRGPVIVKPSREGSSVGMKIVKEEHELHSALQFAAQYDSRILIEDYLPGREFTVAVLDGQVLPVVEIKAGNEFYDYEAKYTKGKTEYLVPAPLSENLTESLQKFSLRVASRFDLLSLCRVDFILHQDQPYFLEVNTLPGMTETSLVPKAAQAAGLSFEDLVEKILSTARLKIH